MYLGLVYSNLSSIISFHVSINYKYDCTSSKLSYCAIYSRIRNPWGRTEFTGDFGARSDVWTSKLLKILDRGQKNDGTFILTYHDFLRRFTGVEVCKAHKCGDWFSASYPDLTQPGHLGCQSSFELVALDPTWIYLSVIQKTKRGRFITKEDRNYWYQAMSIVVLKSLDGASEISHSERMIDHGLDYRKVGEVIWAFFGGSRRVSKPLELQLPVGSYRVVIMHFANMDTALPTQQPQRYYLRVYASRAVIVNTIGSKSVSSMESTPSQRLRERTAPYAFASCIKTFLWNGKKDLPWLKVKQKQIFETSNEHSSSYIDLTMPEEIVADKIIKGSSMKYPMLYVLEGDGVIFVLVVNTSPDSVALTLTIKYSDFYIECPFITSSTTLRNVTGEGVKTIISVLECALDPLPAYSFCVMATAVSSSGGDRLGLFHVAESRINQPQFVSLSNISYVSPAPTHSQAKRKRNYDCDIDRGMLFYPFSIGVDGSK